MKKKICISLIAFIVLALCTFSLWFYFRSSDSSTFTGFIKTLRQNGCNVKDVTKYYAEKYPKNQKLPFNQKVLEVNGINIFVSIENDEMVNSTIEKYMNGFENGLADFSGPPHLYRKGNLLVRYFGDDKNLLKIFEEILGKSYIN